MIHLPHLWTPTKKQLTLALYGLGFVLYGVVFFLGLNQLAETRRLSAETANISSNTNRLIKSQTDILNAIKGVTDDTKMTAEQQTAIIICMLQVPVNQRTTDLQTQSRSQVSASTFGNTSGTSNNSSGAAQVGPFIQSAPSKAPTQSNNPQPKKSVPQKVEDKIKSIIHKIGAIL